MHPVCGLVFSVKNGVYICPEINFQNHTFVTSKLGYYNV